MNSLELKSKIETKIFDLKNQQKDLKAKYEKGEKSYLIYKAYRTKFEELSKKINELTDIKILTDVIEDFSEMGIITK